METAMMNSICRCCATEGVFKCVTIAYTWMGEEEIYADMLKECFDINLNLSESGEDGGICEVCITQLRNASNFKKQVLSTEEQLKKHAENKLFKPNIVKVEVTRNDDDSDDNMSAEEAYSGPEFEVPIKTETEESKPKKRTMATRASTSGAKKSKDDDAGETSTKRHRQAVSIRLKIQGKPNYKGIKNCSIKTIYGANIKNMSEICKHRSNIKEIMLCSNATPIRYGSMGYTCCCCSNHYLEPTDLKTHILETHQDMRNATFLVKLSVNAYVIRLDITSLYCKICKMNLDTLEQLMEHLTMEHQKTIYTDIKNHIIPFKFTTETPQCCICSKTFSKFKMLLEHMNVHYRNYVCDVCDSGFVNRQALRDHKRIHKTGTFKCDHCSKIFDTNARKKAHERTIHRLQPVVSKCGYCNETFSVYRKKEAHLVSVHGLKVPTPECQACNKVFTNRKWLNLHIKKYHLLEKRHGCSQCDKSFFRPRELKEHVMSKHIKLKSFKCTVCPKAYSRTVTLKQHMKRHEEVKRFGCEICGQKFMHKCTWRVHMKTKHGAIL